MSTRASQCEGIVHLGLQSLHDWGQAPATAGEIARFLAAVPEYIDGVLINVDDVRCGLVRLRTSGQVIAVMGKTEEETRYSLCCALKQKREHG